MILDLDVYRCAKLLVDRYGDDAPIEATKRADEMLYKGNMDAKLVWLGIMAACKILLRKAPDEGEAVH